MKIYGVAILAACFLIGHFVGDYLGRLSHLSGNLGGVGFSMLLLIFLYDYSKKKKWLAVESENGILFWSTMYIPVVVAMSATQNVKAAMSGGIMALLVGIFSTLLCYLLIPVISKMGEKSKNGRSS